MHQFIANLPQILKNYLFLSVALYKTTTDQNVNTTRHNPIYYWDLPMRAALNLVENLIKLKLGVSVQKYELLTFSIPQIVM